MTPEEQVRQQIDAQLAASGWVVQTKDAINLSVSLGVFVCELSFKTGEPDYTLFVEGKAIGTVEAIVHLERSFAAGRLIRLERRFDENLKVEVAQAAQGQTLSTIAKSMLTAIDPDEVLARAKQGKGDYVEPAPKEINDVRGARIKEALAPLATNPDLRNLLKKIAKAAEQTIDIISQDTLLYAGPAPQTAQTGSLLATSFRDYNNRHKAEITAPGDFDYAPFSQQGGLGKTHQLFGDSLPALPEELEMTLEA